MTMILPLLVSALAVGLTVGEPPEYKQIVAALGDAKHLLTTNVLSMEGNIPLLNDSRRHYAEIVHVVYQLGLENCGGFKHFDYYEKYQEHLNSSAPEAINNPEIVINEIKELFNEVDNKTSELTDLIAACIQHDDVCNKLIDDTVQDNLDQYGPQAPIFLAAGHVANELKNQNSTFEEVSSNLAAHPYVISSPENLKDIVYAAGNLFQAIKGRC